MPHLLLPGVQIYQSQWVQLAQVDLSGDQVLRQAAPLASQVAPAAHRYQPAVDLPLDPMVQVEPVAMAMPVAQSYK
jgi:type II secretory pathway component PulL